MSKLLISIIGPTAIGKTKLAIVLAQHFKTEIISADSRQFFKELCIGTAVPSHQELKQAKHHFIQHKSVVESYSVGDFEREASEKLAQLFKRKDVVILVGGSGLYVNAVTEGLNVFPTVDASVRIKLISDAKEHGLQFLQNQLKEVDPRYYEQVDIHNSQRVIRALEIYIGSGQTYSSFIGKPKPKRDYTLLSIGLNAERPIIYELINKRVDNMIQNGLLDEVKHVLPFRNYNALQTVGYKELFQYLDSDCTLEFAISEIKKNTRRFAKRQLTWFLKNKDAIWFNYEEKYDKVIIQIEEKIKTIFMFKPQILFVMGVSGSGKTTIGKRLANHLNVPFFDGDAFHPEASIKKMSEGQALNDNDRQGWLKLLNVLALQHVQTGAVIVCSALKSQYRRILGNNLDKLHQFIYLEGSYELINNRLAQRNNHYMPKSLLRSQFDTLEEPKYAIKISIDQTPEKMVNEIVAKLKN